MKLSEIKLDEGLVDAAILFTIAGIIQTGFTNGAQVAALAKSIMAIRGGYVGVATNFAAYYNEFFPTKALLDPLKALSKGETQQLATIVYQVLKTKDEQLASFMQTASIEDILYRATQASANE